MLLGARRGRRARDVRTAVAGDVDVAGDGDDRQMRRERPSRWTGSASCTMTSAAETAKP
jgi:hypothetical protein